MHMEYFFLTFSNIVVVESSNTASTYNIMNTYLPKPSSVLASMFFHLEPDNDFAIRCKQHRWYNIIYIHILEFLRTD
jgi:hypothetical protein